jgi:DNA-binding response OmpR family regulator
MSGVCPCCGHAIVGRPSPLALLSAVRLSPQQRAIAEALAEQLGRWVTSERLITRVYGDRYGGPLNANNQISVVVAQMQRRLNVVGLKIEGRTWHGRRMVWAP